MDKLTQSRVALKLEQLESKLKSFLANYRARNPRKLLERIANAVPRKRARG
jgi:hypothetical protein